MAKFTFNAAKKTLTQACNRYLSHNESEMRGYKAIPVYHPSSVSFWEVLGRENPHKGFSDWVRCEYYSLVGNALFINAMDRREHHYIQKNKSDEVNTILNKDESNHDDPRLVLHNLNFILNLLLTSIHYVKATQLNKIKQLDLFIKYDEKVYQYSDDSPLSTKIYLTLNHMKAAAELIRALAHEYDRGNTIRLNEKIEDKLSNHDRIKSIALHTDLLCERMESSSNSFVGYIKGITVAELNNSLQAKDDETAIKNFETQLKKDKTAEILTINRQSTAERKSKLLSIIGIFIGIGIFTTLGCGIKRLINSGFHSANFFKPLSLNLMEQAQDVITNTEDTKEFDKAYST